MTIHVDAEIKSLLRRLTEQEMSALESNLKRDGCTDPLVVWKEHGILLDGHNRYEICRRLGITFSVAEVSLESREDAIIWVAGHQLGRRNLTADEYAYWLGKEYAAEKGKDAVFSEDKKSSENQTVDTKEVTVITKTEAMENGRGRPKKSSTKSEPNAASKRVAEKRGVNERTVRRADEFATAADHLGQVLGAEVRQGILAGKYNRRDVLAAAKAETPADAMRILEGEPEPTPEPSARETDPSGVPIPAELVEAFATVERFESIEKQFRRLRDELHELVTSKGGIHLGRETHRIRPIQKSGRTFYESVELANLITLMKFAKPYARCPRCADAAAKHCTPDSFRINAKCETCRGGGYVTKQLWDAAPSEMKQVIEGMA